MEQAKFINQLTQARDAILRGIPGKPAIEVPLDSLHFYKTEDGTLKCVMDMEQVIYLADEMIRKAQK